MTKAKKIIKKKKTDNSNHDPVVIDTECEYLIPMSPIGSRGLESEAVTVPVKIANEDGIIKCRKEGYKLSVFVDFYFDYLLYTGYIKKCTV